MYLHFAIDLNFWDWNLRCRHQLKILHLKIAARLLKNHQLHNDLRQSERNGYRTWYIFTKRKRLLKGRRAIPESSKHLELCSESRGWSWFRDHNLSHSWIIIRYKGNLISGLHRTVKKDRQHIMSDCMYCLYHMILNLIKPQVEWFAEDPEFAKSFYRRRWSECRKSFHICLARHPWASLARDDEVSQLVVLQPRENFYKNRSEVWIPYLFREPLANAEKIRRSTISD